YGPELNWPKLARACLETPLVRTPDTFVRYSNVGYGLLAIAVERAYGQVFSAALGGLVLEPLGIEAYLGAEPPRPPANLIGDRSPEVGTPLEPYNSSFWRSL